jgi:hypothetical protein
MKFNNSDQSWCSTLWKPVLLFVLVSALLIAADQLSLHFGLEGARRIVDDLLGGLIAGSIFHLYERQKARRLSEHLHLIDLTNHHIRNALQPLMFVAHGSEGKAQMKVVEECVRRIDWALREVLPGKSQERFVVHTRASTQRNGLTLKSQEPAWSSENEHSQPASTKTQPKPFFTQWFDAWRNRNEKAS